MKKSTVILSWAIYTSIVYIVVYEVTNNPDHPNKALGWIGYLIFLAGLILGTFMYRKANGGFLTFGEGYKAGLLMTLVIAVALTIHYFVYLQMHPDLPEKLLAQVQAQMVNSGMQPDAIDKALSVDRMMFKPVPMVIIGLLVSVLTGAILSLVSAGVSIKNKPFIEDDNSSNLQ